jgi:hypothetical protein
MLIGVRLWVQRGEWVVDKTIDKAKRISSGSW